jgi:hypothetical protein
MGGKTRRGWMGSTVEGKGRAVLGIDHSGPGPLVTCTPQNPHLRRGLLTEWTSWPPKVPNLRKTQSVSRLAGFGINRARKNALIDPFGWQISHNMGQGVFGGIKGKRTPVLGISYSGPGPHETCTPQNPLLRRRLISKKGSCPQKRH